MKSQNKAADTTVIEKRVLHSLQIPRGFRYEPGIDLQFEVSYDKSGLSIVTSCGDDISGYCTNQELSLVGLITYNMTLTGLKPIQSQSRLDTVVVSSDGSITINEALGVASSEEEAQEIIDEGVQVVVGELSPVLRLADGRTIVFNPNNPEEFFSYFNGIDDMILEYRQTVYVVVGQGPVS